MVIAERIEIAVIHEEAVMALQSVMISAELAEQYLQVFSAASYYCTLPSH